MFREALLESAPVMRKRSPWPMATAFTLELILASVLVLLPLISTGILPLATHLAAPPRYTPIESVRSTAPASTTTRAAVSLPTPEVVQIANLNPALSNPFARDQRVSTSDSEDPSDKPQLGIPGGSPTGTNMLIPDHATPPAPARQFVISRSLEAMILNKVIPEYPAVARVAGIQGEVKLHAIIATDGTIQSLTVTSGPAMLRDAALKAVQHWRYRPYMLNGQAVEVETLITVSFHRS